MRKAISFKIKKVLKTPVEYIFRSYYLGNFINNENGTSEKKQEGLLERHVTHAYLAMPLLKKSRISLVSATPNEFVHYSDENNKSNKLKRYIFLKKSILAVKHLGL